MSVDLVFSAEEEPLLCLPLGLSILIGAPLRSLPP